MTTSQRKAGKQQLEIIFQLLEIRVCKKVLLKEEILPRYHNSRFLFNSRYFEHMLILTKYLVPCMFELRDVY